MPRPTAIDSDRLRMMRAGSLVCPRNCRLVVTRSSGAPLWQPGRALHRGVAAMVSCQFDGGPLASTRFFPNRQGTVMTPHKLLLLPGDGIGPEVMAEVKRLIGWLDGAGIVRFEIEEGLVGGSSYDADKVSITDATM